MDSASDKPHYILCAAVWYDDGVKRVHLPRNIVTGIVASGWRHHNCFTILAALYPNLEYMKAPGKQIQGFLTNKGHFVNRLEAVDIALAAGQIKQTKKRLHSEDVW